MTVPLNLDALQALCDAATPGPWSSDASDLANYQPGDVSIWGCVDGKMDPVLAEGIVFNCGAPIVQVGDACDRERENAAFIAAARSAVPALIQEVRRLTVLVEQRDALASELADALLRIERLEGRE